MLLGTLVDIWQMLNPFPILAVTKQDEEENMAVKILKAFSIYKNGKQILSTKTSPKHLNCLSGMRFFSMCWIVYGHLYMMSQITMSVGYAENRMFVNNVEKMYTEMLSGTSAILC